MCTVANIVEDGRTYWVAGGGTPLYSVLLAKRLYAPGPVRDRGRRHRPRTDAPLRAHDDHGRSRAAYRALAWGTMNTAGLHAQLGQWITASSTPSRSTSTATSTRPSASTAEHPALRRPRRRRHHRRLCWRTILMTDQDKRKFVERRLHLVARLPRRHGGRAERAGLPSGTGPWRVVTPWAMYDSPIGGSA